jgi:hypothetical protein
LFAGADRLLGTRRAEIIGSSFPMSSLLYNSLVDNDLVDPDNGLKQQSMHGLIVPRVGQRYRQSSDQFPQNFACRPGFFSD